jgi:subtilisin family serine protease
MHCVTISIERIQGEDRGGTMNEKFTQQYEVKEVLPSSVRDDIVDWGLVHVHAPSVWAKATGLGIKVAVLDTGIDPDHPDLAENIKACVDFTGSPYGVEDKQGHGTHVAGIIGAADNGSGVIGVAPQVELYCAKVLGDSGSGSFQSIIKGIEWAIQNKVHVINMSLGCGVQPPEEMHRAIRAAYDAGIIMVAATGNENTKVGWPAMYDEVIAVSAMAPNHERADFSNYGIKNEIMAPGVDILSCYKDGGYARLSGTSMATPIITGAVALYLSAHQGDAVKPTIKDVHQKLIAACDDLGAPGKDDYTGAGLINLEKLMT